LHAIENKAAKQDTKAKSPINEKMYTSMSDIGFSNAMLIISQELQGKMTDNSSNWKIRTDTIDEIFNIITEKI
jgi:hypothetical protein